jgi:small subunit ribosomal protein S6
MKNYELTVVLPGKSTAASKKDVVERIGAMVKANKGKVAETEDWGKKELAYDIDKNKEGVFLHFVLELPTEVVKNISEKVKLEDDIIRHLLVVADKKK